MVSKETTIFFLGTLVVILPYLGVPDEWKRLGLMTIGILLIWFGYWLRRAAFLREIDQGNGEQVTDSFAEYNHKQLKLPEV